MELEADESFGPVVRIQTASPPPESAPNSPVRHIDPAFLSPPPAFQKRKRPRRPSTTSATPIILSFEVDQEPDPPKPKRPSVFCASSKEGTEVLVPPPPLFRPTTFWRNTKRSGVTGASYSPGSYLIRRSTFIAAGLSLDRPIADLSAFCVESRVGLILLPPDTSL